MCILAGFVMLFTPGQGILTILFGFALLRFKGKQKLVAWLRRYPLIDKAARKLERLRRSRGEQPERDT